MEHVAIMKKSWGLTQKIMSGQKQIESRWYNAKYSPWDKIKAGEHVYFKDSGEPVTIKAEVERVVQFAGLTPEKVKEVLYEYGQDDGLGVDKIPEYFGLFRNKKYCILVFLMNPQKIEPFDIDKSGFGAMCAWISIDNIEKIKKVDALR